MMLLLCSPYLLLSLFSSFPLSATLARMALISIHYLKYGVGASREKWEEVVFMNDRG